VDTVPFGKVLLIDGLAQSCDLDEFIYHESLVHPALLSHPNPRRVYIGGGGECSTAREVLRHSSVEVCTMVDIDGKVVDFCREHLTVNAEAFADKRLDLVIDDAKVQLENATEPYDVIIMDLDDPLEGGPCYQLYTKAFYEMCKSKLAPGGILVTQSGTGGVKGHKLVFSAVHNTLSKVFPVTMPYNQAVYSFGDEWSWVLAFSDKDAKRPTPEEIDARIAERITGGAAALKFLDGESYAGLFCLGKHVRESIKNETRVLGDGVHAFMHGSGQAK
jgi:thermospermine synthase